VALAGVKSTVSVGIAAHDGADTDFSRMYRDADAALYQVRVEGKSCIGVFEPSATAALQADKPQALTV
jgi:GGDEF domain-containing protein